MLATSLVPAQGGWDLTGRMQGTDEATVKLVRPFTWMLCGGLVSQLSNIGLMGLIMASYGGL